MSTNVGEERTCAQWSDMVRYVKGTIPDRLAPRCTADSRTRTRWAPRTRLLFVITGLAMMLGAGRASALASSLAQSEEFKNIKVLNNFCWELLNIKRPEGLQEKISILVPMDRWVFIQSHAEVPSVSGTHEARITIDSDPRPILVHSRTTELEAMRYLKAGTHGLKLSTSGNAKITSVVVRAIPELQYALYGESCLLAAYGRYDWEFLKRDILPNVNVLVYNRHITPEPGLMGEWKSLGRLWIADVSAAFHLFDRGTDGKLSFKGTQSEAAEELAKFWTTGTLAVRHPLVDGLLIDEMVGGTVPVYDAFRESAQKLYENPLFKRKRFDLYAGGAELCRDNRGKELVRFCMEHGSYIAVEWYLQEVPTLQGARDAIDNGLVRGVQEWEKSISGITPRIIATLACESVPSESADRYPEVNFRVFMDMQMRTLATHPSFFGVGGIQWYKSGYADEEVVRWAGRLYRHYCIEGNTEPLTKDPYELRHIRNPDFAEGTEGWEIHSAKDDSVQPKSYKGYGQLQGRWGSGMGDAFLWTRRSADRPNVFTQEIKNLKSGRLYSMKMITSDYQDLSKGRSEKRQNAVSIKIGNVDLLTEPEKSFQYTYAGSVGDKPDKFDSENPYWLNYHRLIFRAKAPTAKLSVTDWQSEDTPGGPAGQEIMFNFIQIQPYLE